MRYYNPKLRNTCTRTTGDFDFIFKDYLNDDASKRFSHDGKTVITDAQILSYDGWTFWDTVNHNTSESLTYGTFSPDNNVAL